MIKIREGKLIGANAGTSYLVTLPKGWVRDVGLSLGDYVGVYRDEHDNLILKPKKEK